MAENSGIEWTDATWNPTTGCTKISPGCAACYIDRTPPFRMAGRKFVKGSIPIEFHPDRLEKPLHWRKPRRVFVNSLSDLFHLDIPFGFIDRVFAVMALTPRHTYQVLTKRPERMAEYIAGLTADNPGVRLSDVAHGFLGDEAECWIANFINGWSTPKEYRDGNPANGTVRRWPLPNVWLGTSVENQAAADERIPHLLNVPAAVRFLSVEPLLEMVDLTQHFWSCTTHGTGDIDLDYDGDPYCEACRYERRDGCFEFAPTLDWVIVGGESGPKARPCDIDWIRSIRDQCQAAGVACFVKQLGADPWDNDRVDFVATEERQYVDGTRIGLRHEVVMTGGGGVDAPYPLDLRDRKGGDWSEWPSDLRVREFPVSRLERR